MYSDKFRFEKDGKFIQWDNGKLSGDSGLIAQIREANNKDHGLLGEPPEPMTKGRYLDSFTSARGLFRITFPDYKNNLTEPPEGFCY
jgi:hypothetical protein